MSKGEEEKEEEEEEEEEGGGGRKNTQARTQQPHSKECDTSM